MAKNINKKNDEIEIGELIVILWRNKWKIVITTIISLLTVMIYQSTERDNFFATTKISPISNAESNKYTYYNYQKNFIYGKNPETGFQLPEITRLKLLESYVEILNNKLIFEDAIRKYNLLDRSIYINEKKYDEAVIKLASTIRITHVNDNKKETQNSIYLINFQHYDFEKWKSVLNYVNKIANDFVKSTIVKDLSTRVSIIKQDKNFSLEDLIVRINNIIDDYDRKTSDKLSFLHEQSKMAKELGIEKNTIESQSFNTQDGILTNIKTDSPLFLRGYIAIDKEIDLINSRNAENRKAFINGLFELEQEKRSIEQDKTLERIELALQTTPLFNDNKFYAAKLDIISTEFKYNDKSLNLILAIFIGFILGVFFAFISDKNELNTRVRKKTN